MTTVLRSASPPSLTLGSGARFNAVKDALSGNKLLQAKNKAELEKELKKRSKALEKMGEAMITKMSGEQKEAFDKLQAERQAKVDAIMKDSSLSFEEKVKKIQAVDDSISASLADLQTEVLSF